MSFGDKKCWERVAGQLACTKCSSLVLSRGEAWFTASAAQIDVSHLLTCPLAYVFVHGGLGV